MDKKNKKIFFQIGIAFSLIGGQFFKTLLHKGSEAPNIITFSFLIFSIISLALFIMYLYKNKEITKGERILGKLFLLMPVIYFLIWFFLIR